MAMVVILSLMQVSSVPHVASASDFWGLGKAGLITTVVVSLILIVTVIWLINGTKERD